MLGKTRKVLKEKKGQIGQILVVVMLIILAVIGIGKYVMPNLQKSGQLSDTAGGQIEDLTTQAVTASIGSKGETVKGTTVISAWDKYAKQEDVTVSYENDGDVTAQTGSEDGMTYYDYVSQNSISQDGQVNEIADYKIKDIKFYKNGNLQEIDFEMVN